MVLKNNSCTYSLKAFFFLSFSLSPFESYLKLLDLLNFINNNNKYPLLDKPPPHACHVRALSMHHLEFLITGVAWWCRCEVGRGSLHSNPGLLALK